MIVIRQLISLEELRKNNFYNIGFFQSIEYQEIFIRHFSKIEDIIILGIYDKEKIIGYGIFEKQEDRIIFSGMKKVLGEQDLADYGDIVVDPTLNIKQDEIWKEIKKWFTDNGYKKIQLDYVREDSKIYDLFKENAIEQIIAPFIILPQNWEGYLESLERTDRKELKRKLKRLNTIAYEYKTIYNIDKNLFNDFIKLHRLSNSDKNEFMSPDMEIFFKDLVNLNSQNWRPCMNFLIIENKTAAIIFTFENKEYIYGYNSGYDPLFNYYSVGLLVHALTIQRAISEKKKIYDFLRGTERYKFDLGGKPMRLYQINIVL